MRKDPVCLMDVDEREAAIAGYTSERDGQMQFFCSEACKLRYEEDPLSFGMRTSEFQSPDNLADPGQP